MSAGDGWTLAAVGWLVIAAAVLAAAEIALSRITRVHAIHLEETGRRWARFLVRITADPARYLNPVLVATLACHILGTTLATTVAVRVFGGGGEWIATAVMTSVIFVFAESAPKTYTILHTDAVALVLGPMIYGLGRALNPVARLLVGISNVLLPGRGLPKGPFMSEEEIRHIVDVAEEEEVIEQREREMIHSVFEFGDTVVREIMTPRPDMIVVKGDRPAREALDIAMRHGFSRVPVIGDDSDDVVGVAYAKDLFRAMRRDGDGIQRVSALARDAYFVPETMRVSDLLREMQSKRVHMAIVADEYGDVAGLVTLEDVLEEIVGEIIDEYDVEEPSVVPLGTAAWRVQAKLPIAELNEFLDTDLPTDEEWQTVGGLVSAVLGKIPEEGEEVTFQGLQFRAEKVQRRRIGTLLVSRTPAGDNSDG